MRNGCKNASFDKSIQHELDQASKGKGPHKDVLDGGTEIMYLPDEGIERWKQIIERRPILGIGKKQFVL